MTLGEKIQWGRRRRGLSQQQLAEKLCVSRSAIAKWETDKGMPDVENLKLLSKLLGMTVDNLLDADTAAILEPCRPSAFGGCDRVQKDRLMLQRFPDDTIIPLSGRPDASITGSCSIRGFLTPMPFGQPAHLKSQLHRDRTFYLVETANEQLFVTVTDDFMELRPLEHPVQEQSFPLNGWHFIRLRPLT